jgi:hypothetical protein
MTVLLLTPELTKAICENLTLCMTRVDAALQAGISHRTFTSWMARGETGEEPYAAFHGEVVKAEMTAQRRLLGHVTKAASDGDPRHAEWLLERRFPRSWGDRQAGEVPYRRLPRKRKKEDEDR